MAQVRTDAQGPEAQQRAGPRGSADRPVSPHLQVWRWHVTMTTSILHRATGMALYFGALILAGWAIALATSEGAYNDYMGLLGSPLGRFVMFGLTFSLTYHFANGIRHLIWDMGAGMDVKTANVSGWFTIVFGVVAAVGIWVAAYLMGVL
jgi:succinate dehydrogenase / fumarate reductase, cytochrome b subunit